MLHELAEEPLGFLLVALVIRRQTEEEVTTGIIGAVADGLQAAFPRLVEIAGEEVDLRCTELHVAGVREILQGLGDATDGVGLAALRHLHFAHRRNHGLQSLVKQNGITLR